MLRNGADCCTTGPFRSPHHTISDAGLIGGGSGMPRPGEVSLAHNGVLFLDEFPEFPRDVLEMLRQPLEDGAVTIARANMTLCFPSSFMLVAAMNPCPCGFYRRRHPRMPLHARADPAVSRQDQRASARPHRHSRRSSRRALQGTARASASEPSERFARASNAARAVQQARGYYNSHMPSRMIRKQCALDDTGERTLEMAVRRMGLSARAHDRILKVARTIADLGGSPAVSAKHVAEAVQYRSLDRNYWT